MSLIKTITKWVGLGLIGIFICGGLFFAGLRFNDGPVEFFPWFTISIGGPFRSGIITPTPQDWSFLVDRQEIEFQTESPQTSRTVWLAVHEERLFLVSGYMNTGIGRLWKQWPTYMAENNNVILRIDEDLYMQQLERVFEGPQIAPVMSEFSRKYGNGDPGSELAVTAGFVWMFEVLPR